MIGDRFITSGGIVWRKRHGALMPVTMPHFISGFSVKKAWVLLVSSLTILVRWEERFDEIGTGEWWHIIKDFPEELSGLPKKTRNQVRRGIKNYEATPTLRDSILDEGYAVYCSAFKRYETFERMLSQSEFLDAIKAMPAETEFWGVRDRESGSMVAFSENLVRDNACFYNTIWFEPQAMKNYAGYALFHEMNKHYLNGRWVYYVSDGARNISHETGVHEFLEHKFLFRRAYAKLRVVYFPGVGLVVRLLFPFKWWFERRSSGLFQKIAVVLEQERIRRACLEEN